MAVCVLFPVAVLLLYPTKTFQRCLGLCPVQWHPLHALAAAFNGCYKDGTNGSKDYRYFGAFYMLVQILICVPLLGYHCKPYN